MTTSHKHKGFIRKPMEDKAVEALPGIGKVLGGRLRHNGYGKAKNVLRQFRVLKKKERAFEDWLKDTCGANMKQAADCYEGLLEWSRRH
ncbi:barrier-to-autointegration factor-like [Latimeria chalumnae]|nr:PREDICTED: barrier-to-autointegration factor-like [Latimeria chalumnae]|eukprot:XP_014353405.1 PREDICTED: barrier-to-autointegration factor-like [Latimeria chalumnae]